MADLERAKPEQAPLSNARAPAFAGNIAKGCALLFIITNTSLLINLTVRESGGHIVATPVAAMQNEFDDDEGMLGGEYNAIPRRDFVYIIQSAGLSSPSALDNDHDLIDLVLHDVANPVASVPVGKVEAGSALHHLDTPETHIAANPAGPTFYSADRPEAVLRYRANAGNLSRTRVRLGPAQWQQVDGRDVISFRSVQLEGKTRHFSQTMADVSVQHFLRDLKSNSSFTSVSLEVSVPSTATCGSDPADLESCRNRLSNWPIAARDLQQCKSIYSFQWGRSPGSSLGRIDGLGDMDECMAECCLNERCKAITFHTNRNPTRCWLLDREYEGKFRAEPNPNGVKVANKVFTQSDAATGRLQADATELSRMLAEKGLECRDPNDYSTCQCVRNWCNSISPASECHTSDTGAICTCRSGYVGTRCEAADTEYRMGTQESRNRVGIYCDNYADDQFHTCRCQANSRGDGFCANGGTAHITYVGCTCSCPPSHIGTRCETRAGPRL